MLIIEHLHKTYQTAKEHMTVLDSVSLVLNNGRSLALVGESGAGKSSLAKCILGIEPFDSGQIEFEGKAIHYDSDRQLRQLWKNAQMIWQDPYLAVSPYWPVWKIIAEPLINFKKLNKTGAHKKVEQLLDMVGLNASFSTKRSHQLSGGECQRVCIARALSVNPKLLICDEPVSALDLPMQTRIMDLIEHLRFSFGLTVLLITHDMGLAYRYADDIAVLQHGRIVENGPTGGIFTHAVHSYTKELIAAVPKLKWSFVPE